MNIRPAQDASNRWVTFELAGQLYGLEILKVQEVLADAEIESVPGAPSMILGVINLRGSIVTMIDLRRRLGLAPRTLEAPVCCVVVDCKGDGRSESRREPVGLRVDRVVDVRRIADAAIKPAPVTGGQKTAAASAVLGVLSRPGEMLTLLDADRLVTGLESPLAHAA
ncbi:chemotaxis protein CheW [uncultured Nevskia sp.]|uniref:chemotaxis protein CheW n=1 Tax=uncultured Nevskia sp. TaxID=228950 RepID=UPI0025E03AA2|nr:chemotaxis protein CheW [uncultured Nevskia sp.]